VPQIPKDSQQGCRDPPPPLPAESCHQPSPACAAAPSHGRTVTATENAGSGSKVTVQFPKEWWPMAANDSLLVRQVRIVVSPVASRARIMSIDAVYLWCARLSACA
jgi:hypothetical protein